MDFKTAKEIVLALKEIAKNIQSDKSSNTNDDSDNNNDDLQYSVLINPHNDSYGNLYGIIMFKDLIENLLFEEQSIDRLGFHKNSAETFENLGELENSEILIKCFNKTIDVINELFNKYDQLEEFYSSTIILSILIGNQSENPYYSNLKNGQVPETCCFITKNKDSEVFKLQFDIKENYNKHALCDTTTKFDENSLIYTQED